MLAYAHYSDYHLSRQSTRVGVNVTTSCGDLTCFAEFVNEVNFFESAAGALVGPNNNGEGRRDQI